ncbi:hypothetical protein ACNOYE_33190 [Nannocystaceae bacterium ST9]
MSRYQSVALELGTIDQAELIAGLRELGLTPEQAEYPGDRVMLHGSLECAGEPVDLRLAAGVLGSVEDFGLVVDAGRWRLVCGEVDRKLLERTLIGPLAQALALMHARRAAARAELELGESVEPDGTRRLRLRLRQP